MIDNDNYIGGESWVRSSPQYEGEGLFGFAGMAGLGGAFDTGNSRVDQLVADANIRLAALLRPSWPAIDQSPLPADQKALLKSQPVTFYLQLFGTMENLAAEVVMEANRLAGRTTRTIGLPGLTQVTINMDPNQTDLDRIPSQSGRHLVKVLRLAMQWMVLTYQDALHLAQAVARVFAKYGMQGAEAVRSFILTVGGRAQAQAQQLAYAGQQAVQQVTSQAARAGLNAGAQLASQVQQILTTITQNLPPVTMPPPPNLPIRLSGMGLGQTGAGETAAGAGAAATGATAAGAATGVVSTPMIAALIVAIITALLPVVGAAGVATIQAASNATLPGQPVPGTTRPGPNGETEGYWLDGVWHSTSQGPFGQWTVPVGLGVGAIALLYILKK